MSQSPRDDSSPLIPDEVPLASELSAELVASCGEGLVAYDEDLRHVAWNPVLERWTGLSALEVLGRAAAEVFPHLRDQEVMPLLERALTGETVRSHDISWPSSSAGPSLWIAATYSPHRDAAGKIKGVVGLLRDVTGRREAEGALPAAAHELRALVEQSVAGVFLIQDARYRYVNPKLATILGYTQEELPALTSVLDGVVEEDRPSVLSALTRWGDGERQPSRHKFGVIRKDGERIDVEVYGTGTEFEGRPAAIGTLVDVTNRQRDDPRLEERAFSDPLTKLPNLVRFSERLELELAQARRYKRKLAVVYIDLDSFKFVNDSWGHAIGDRLLQSLALRLKRRLRQFDTIARVAGDEFVILMPEVRDADDATGIAQKLLSIVRNPFQLDGRTLQVTASVGIAMFPADGEDAEALLRNADAATDRAKAVGRNTFQLCTPELTNLAIERLSLQSGLQLALKQNEFVVHYQPLVSLISGRTVGFEALVRWQHPQKGLVMPGTFIPVAEETGLILGLGEWVLETSCRQLKQWHEKGKDLGALRIAVNFSARQFQERHLTHTVSRVLTDSGLEPQHLEIEITESIAMEGAEVVVANLNMLRSMGIGIAIDDFGTGYSSMSYLKRYPITSLKIDRSFVTDLPVNPADAGIVRAIIEMAHGSRLHVTAEGVETKEQFMRLQEAGCDEMQGYWVSRPLTLEGVDQHLAEQLALWKT
ncbi:MAG TPA: EAL domain-containing protein [Thermoanaerobaculia bacterium]|jgi:diguanylate cyclase (GGDEF)-like protein/PAS domain S-box-containing protein